MKLTIAIPDGATNPVIVCDEEAQILKDFIETELQQDIAFTDHLLNQLNIPERGIFEISGNSFTLTVKNNRFSIDNLYCEEERIRGDLSFFIETLELWKKALTTTAP